MNMNIKKIEMQIDALKAKTSCPHVLSAKELHDALDEIDDLLLTRQEIKDSNF